MFLVAKGACIVGWYPDESVKGETDLKAVTCETVIEVLSGIISKQALGEELELEERDIVIELSRGYIEASK